jgi:CubicO group peptidase (beta-lactamase class C family)
MLAALCSSERLFANGEMARNCLRLKRRRRPIDGLHPPRTRMRTFHVIIRAFYDVALWPNEGAMRLRSEKSAGFLDLTVILGTNPSIQRCLKTASLFFLLLLVLHVSEAQRKAQGATDNEYPGKHCTNAGKPEDRGWSSVGLAAAKEYAASIDTAAVVIVDDGIIVSQWGATSTKFNGHSIRKSFLSALYGIAVANGKINLNATLEQLGIDDNEPSLTPEEKQARIIDLLKARSGIYHAALYETPTMRAEKPPRWSHPPRSFWSYNNWDFNALGTIYEKLTGDTIYHSFDAQIAQRIGMEDYESKEQEYVTGPDSIHRAYPFRMTARDMARFGLLYLRSGRWRDSQLIPIQWVRDSTTAYSVADGNARDGYSGYGYLWWVAVNGNHYPNVELPDGSFSAWGAGGHFIAVIPAFNVVVVHRVNTDDPAKKVTLEQFGKLLRLILAAKKH